jgi:hypothetical protein
MSEETEYTFAHFVEPELLEARVADLDGKYTAEEVAATAFYLGVLSVTGFSRIVPLHGDPHYLMHVMSNVYAGEWLAEVIKQGSINPSAMYQQALSQCGWAMASEHDGMEDIRAEKPETPALEDGLPPMDKDTFNRLWGGHAA